MGAGPLVPQTSEPTQRTRRDSTSRKGRQMRGILREIFCHDHAAGSTLRFTSATPFPRTPSALTRAVWLNLLGCAVLLCGQCQTASAAGLMASGQSLAPINSTLVELTFTNPSLQLGTVDIDLFDNLAPLTVANFMQYVNASIYNNTIIHRVDTSAGVIQGGGFNTQAGGITTIAPIVDEYSRANTRGTIAMARNPDPNSATSQWFINTVDNSVSLGPANDGFGFAVFGWVVGSGMSVVDTIQAVPTISTGSFTQLPVVNHVDGTAVTLDNLIVLTSAALVKVHPSFQNPVVGLDVNNDNSVTTLDALVVINDLIANSNHAVASKFTGTNYIDVNGDGQVTPLDALQVINHFLTAGSLTSSQLMTSSLAIPPPTDLVATSLGVPEPATLVLAIAAAVALGGFELRRGLRRQRGSRVRT